MAHRLGQALVDNQYELVYGSTNVGSMGEVADTVPKAGGVVRGVIPESFAYKVSHQGLNEQRTTNCIRKETRGSDQSTAGDGTRTMVTVSNNPRGDSS